MDVAVRIAVPVGLVRWRDPLGCCSAVVKLTFDLSGEGAASLALAQEQLNDGEFDPATGAPMPSDFVEAKSHCDLMLAPAPDAADAPPIRAHIGAFDGVLAVAPRVADRSRAEGSMVPVAHHIPFPAFPLAVEVDRAGRTFKKSLTAPGPAAALLICEQADSLTPLRLTADTLVVDPWRETLAVVYRATFHHEGDVEKEVTLVVDALGKLASTPIKQILHWPRQRAAVASDLEETDDSPTPPPRERPHRMPRTTVIMRSGEFQAPPSSLSPGSSVPAAPLSNAPASNAPVSNAPASSAPPSSAPPSSAPPSSAFAPASSAPPSSAFAPASSAPPSSAFAPASNAHVLPPTEPPPPELPVQPTLEMTADLEDLGTTGSLPTMELLVADLDSLTPLLEPQLTLDIVASPLVEALPFDLRAPAPKPASSLPEVTPVAGRTMPIDISTLLSRRPELPFPKRASSASIPDPPPSRPIMAIGSSGTPLAYPPLPFAQTSTSIPRARPSEPQHDVSGTPFQLPSSAAPPPSQVRASADASKGQPPGAAPTPAPAPLVRPGVAGPPISKLASFQKAELAMRLAAAPPPGATTAEPSNGSSEANVKIEGLSLEEFTSLRAELWASVRPEREVLKAHGLTPLRWRLAERSWKNRIAASCEDPNKAAALLASMRQAAEKHRE